MQRLLSGLIGLALVLLLAVPVGLHFTQKAHNQLTIGLADLDPAGATPAVPGEAFGRSVKALIDHELGSGTGWRPNDLLPWGPRVAADNNANRQLGILQALRETVRVFKDHLTKVSSEGYDQNLVAAETLLRNDAYKWAFPSAENRYEDASKKIDAYIKGLRSEPQTSRQINVRNVEMIRLLQAWGDLLGDAHSMLYKRPISWFEIDDVYYHSQGYAHVIGHILPAVELDYRREIDARPILRQLFDEARAALDRAATMKPLVVLNGGDTSLLANHLRNLDAYITEARQKLYSIREELEK